MWELDYKESWALKNWCFWTVVMEKTLESPLYCKEIQPVHPEGNQSWIFIGRTDAEVKAPILRPPDSKNWLIWKDPDAGKDWRWGEKGTTEDEMVVWHHRFDGRVWVSSKSWWWTEKPGMLQFMRLQSQTQLSDWAELNWIRETAWAIFKWKISTWFWHGHLCQNLVQMFLLVSLHKFGMRSFESSFFHYQLCAGSLPLSHNQAQNWEGDHAPSPPPVLQVTLHNLPRSEHVLTPRWLRRFLLKGSHLVLELLWIREELNHGCPPIYGASSSHRRSKFSQEGPKWGPLVS